MEKKLGKIETVYIGKGGYQNAMFGITFQISGDGWGVGDFWGQFNSSVLDNYWGEWVTRIDNLMEQAKVGQVSKLKGIPVEASWIDRDEIYLITDGRIVVPGCYKPPKKYITDGHWEDMQGCTFLSGPPLGLTPTHARLVWEPTHARHVEDNS